MISLQVKIEDLKNDYPEFYDFFLTTLRNSQSKFKNYSEKKFKCYYYLGFYMKRSKQTEDYYENLYQLEYNDRIIEEQKKARVTITLVAGKFALSDQKNEIGDKLESTFNDLVRRKMYYEQLKIQNDDVLKSIPDLDKLIKQIENEQEKTNNFMSEVFGEGFTKQKELSPQERLNQLIENEDFEGANEFIKKHPELKRKNQ